MTTELTGKCTAVTSPHATPTQRSTLGIRCPSRIVSIALLALLSQGCFNPSETVRVIDGRTITGRFVDERAYAAHARGAIAEERGETTAAIEAYEDAIDYDPHSPELWTRLATLLCSANPEDADDAFERAQVADPDYEPLWRERSRCARVRGRRDLALVYARQAVLADPDSPEATLLVADLLMRRGETTAALRWLTAFGARSGAELSAPAELPLLARLRDALLAGDLAAARDLAIESRTPPGLLAIMAAEVGRTELARAQGELVLAADPTDPDARIAALVASDLAHDAESFTEHLHRLSPTSRPTPRATLLFAALIARRTGEPIEAAFSGPPAATSAAGVPEVTNVAPAPSPISQ